MANTNLSNRVAGWGGQFLLIRLAVDSVANNRKSVSNFALVETLSDIHFLEKQRLVLSML